jgi:hypothetical protein
MSVRTSKLRRRVFSAVLSGALGFGVMTAAAEVRNAYAGNDPACNTGQCNGSCRASGAQYGFCDSVGCVCVL